MPIYNFAGIHRRLGFSPRFSFDLSWGSLCLKSDQFPNLDTCHDLPKKITLNQDELLYNKHSHCPVIKAAQIRMSLGDQRTPSTILIHSGYIPGVSLEGACTNFTYCDRPGFILRTGHFVLKTEDIPLTITLLIDRFPSCNKIACM